MLRSLEIQNYRNLRHLTIEKLGRVNLLVGKNNTGKTSVLEAVYLWVNNGRFERIYECLEIRDGFLESISEDSYLRSQALLSSLFTDRLSGNREGTIKIIFWRESNLSELAIRLQYVKLNPIITVNLPVESLPEVLRLAVSASNDTVEHIILAEQFIRLKEPNFPDYGFPRELPNQFIRSNGENNHPIGLLFDKIATTDWEDEVVNALKIIDPRISKLAFRTDTISNKRYPVVRLEGSNNPLPLRSMGDGINRILTIILAMVNCENGYLLIDEFENGLHYSVQEKLWEIIFYLAERINIQVFATTHSNDTIKAFGEVANVKPEYNDAQLIQLRNIKGEISAVLFNSQDVEIATETDYLDLR